jgi:CheY-like chemotaxis protein
MGGEIWVESEPGMGSKFEFTVQLRHIDKPCLQLIKEKENQVVNDKFEGKKILLVEDIEINREIVLSLLEPTGLTIKCAGNGIEAVRMYGEAPEEFSMILMDIQMPEMDGYKATRTIRSLNIAPNAKTIPIIAMTANVFREDVEKCVESGMNGHIGKPIDINELMNQLRKYLT